MQDTKQITDVDHGAVILLDVDGTIQEQRIDKLLSLLLEDKSRSFLQKLIADGAVTVDEKPVKASFKAKEGSVIRVELPMPQDLEVLPQDIPLDILYEDEDVLVINKPKNMVVHPAPGHMTDTVVNAVLYHCRGQLSGINGVLRPGIVHRIDKDTTGSLIICKNDMAHQSLAAQLAEHSIERTYRALVWGSVQADEGVIDKPIGRDEKNRKKMAIAPYGKGKRAVTHYTVLQRFGKLSYIECRLETGRTHQIRVHMADLGHPLLGDEIYGRFKAPEGGSADAQSEYKRLKKELTQAGLTCAVPEGMRGQCLHAMRLGFIHPRTGQQVVVDAPLPQYFEALLERIKQGNDEGRV
ncbi:MAG: RluA family pseudouridine synthase [Lachnospiraceae bacterium]|nr:RluA family pseudouridine synthase [Lachnospiraceae bacterium]